MTQSANSVPAPSAPAPTPAQMLAALAPSQPQSGPGTPGYYSQVMLGLATQAYTAEYLTTADAIRPFLLTALTDPKYTPLLPAFGQPGVVNPQVIQGGWSLDWGPGMSPSGSNLVYITSYRSQGKPLFFAVGIRGTNTAVKGIALIQQIMQDINAFKTVDWAQYIKNAPNPNHISDVSKLGGHVALGSASGFVKIASVTSSLSGTAGVPQPAGNYSVAAALSALLNVYPNTPIVVTGHSLGGCQTQLMGSYLAWQFGPTSTGQRTTVIPYAFAPSTAGDAGFSAAYQAQCPSQQFWFNTLDLVPYAFIQMPAQQGGVHLSGLKWAEQNLWTAYRWPNSDGTPSGQSGPPLSASLSKAIDKYSPLLPKVYARPPGGLFPLAGTLPPQAQITAFLTALHGKPPPATGDDSPTGSNSQALWQHFPPCYAAMMSAQYGSALASFDFKSINPPS